MPTRSYHWFVGYLHADVALGFLVHIIIVFKGFKLIHMINVEVKDDDWLIHPQGNLHQSIIKQRVIRMLMHNDVTIVV